MADAFPTSYKDPLYASLDTSTEQKLGLPVGSLSSIRLNGERSNHDEVSSAGARTVYQFTPATRNAILKKYGIDVTLSPQNASEGAGLLIKEGLDRNGGDLAAAVGEYIGGLDRQNWGRQTKAYVNRVMVGQKQSKDSALDNAFAAWMAANPAAPTQGTQTRQPAGAATTEPGSAKPDPLADAFGAWLESGQTLPDHAIDAYAAGTLPPAEMERIRAGVANGSIKLPVGVNLGNTSATGRIPGIDPSTQFSQPAPDPSLGDMAVGAGEAVANVATGMTGGAVGMAAGFGKGLATAILDGNFGTRQAADMVEQEAMKGADALTYQPRTQTGQRYAQNVGEVMAQALPVMPLTGELAALHASAGPVVAAAGDAGRAAAATVGKGAARVRQAVQPLVDAVRPGGADATPTPGTMASGGAAGADMALQRRTTAESLPVPIELTKGQAERSFEQQRFEQETAKDPSAGAPLRERYAEQNDRLLRNFDVMVDQTGGEAPSLRAVGESVDKALIEQIAKDKAQIKIAYKNADKAGELSAPVSLSNVIDYLNANAPDAVTAPLLDAARKWVIKLGVAKEEGGQLVPTGGERPAFSTLMNSPAAPSGVTLKTAETLRQAINRSTDYEPTNVRQATILKQLIDQATEGKGGDLYQQARALRSRFAQNYENRANIAKLVNNKRGLADRQVALEDVFNHSMLNSSLDDVRNMRRVLQRSGPAGEQAWRDLQGQTMQWIKDQATKNVATDIRGNQIVSAAGLDRALKTLDHDGKLDFIFGKKGAETLRELNDIVKVVHTAPPGSVNTSNTASVLLAAITEAGLTGSMTGLPVPVLTTMKALSGYAKHRRLQAKVMEALGKKRPPPDLRVVPKTAPDGKPMH